MAWTLEFSGEAKKQLGKLDRPVAERILRYLGEHAACDNPRAVGKNLKGQLADYWRYRVGDYRVLCQLVDSRMIVLVVEIGHRREVYR